MSPFIATAEGSPNSADESSTASVCRTALYLESQGQPILGWLHRPGDAICVDHGVIICPPIGYEQVHAHRSLRHLADAVAGENIPAFRIDFHGTGDSAGSDNDPRRIETWLANIRDAAAWMRQNLGCRRISLIGLRLGATMAAVAASESEPLNIDNLVLWSPVVKGRAYVREMKALSLTASSARSVGDAVRDIEAAGFVVSGETADSISQINLLESTPRCSRVLIVSRDDMAEDTSLRDHWSPLGITVEQMVGPGYADMMAEPHFTKVPSETIEQIVAWLAAKIGADHTTDELPCIQVKTSSDANFAGPGGSRLRERACRISCEPDLFGIISEPQLGALESLPSIILLNAGSSYRVGPGRLNVLLARRLSAHGFRVLRMDQCGLGDSITTDPRTDNDPYAATMFRDIELAMAYLEHECGSRRVVLMGLCSGAYAAFQSAAQLPDGALVESVLINPLTFFWKDGMSLETSVTKQLITWHFYLTSLVKPGKWWRFVTGKSEGGIRGAIGRLFRRMQSINRPTPAGSAEPCCLSDAGGITHPQDENVPRDLDRITDAGRRLAMFCSATDPGHFILMFHARRKAIQMQRADQLTCFFIEGADHTFSSQAPRNVLFEMIEKYLLERYANATWY